MATLTSFSPIAQTPGQPVTINGTGFTGATSVLFGGVEALFFNIVSDTEITAWPSLSGTNVVTVVTTAGTVSLTGFSSWHC